MGPDIETLALLTGAFFVAATLYSSVGHGGASAYLAIMALFSLPQEVMRPTALVLNILVASVGAWRPSFGPGGSMAHCSGRSP